ncbi:MAG: pyruvate, phosphate dikinase [Chloroflexota bacterium]|nr:pyruvate, phosphate dikinase [Chloroflexota bacterium]
MTTTANPPSTTAPATTGHKWVYLFPEGNGTMKELLGGKGAGLSEMTNAGLPVPPGFTITTEACRAYYDHNKQFPPGMWDQALAALHEVEAQAGKKLGDPTNPLLVSVRSGAKFSMPGMMDTVLNLGLNEQTLKGVIAATGNERFAYDSYRRFIQMFSKIVLDIPADKFEHKLDALKTRVGAQYDTDLTTANLRDLAGEFKALVRESTGHDFPDDPLEQMRLAVEAVFASWNNKRAFTYRDLNKIPHDLGTAVNIVTMVFGNMGDDSGTGVAFTRNPATGEDVLYGEFLMNAQGEDVVAGIRTPQKISQLRDVLPDVYTQFEQIGKKLESHYRDAQDLEFTVERGKLYMLQTRSAKRTAAAAVKMAVDMANAGLITKEEAIGRVEPAQVVQLLLPRFAPEAITAAQKENRVLAKGLNASPGAASGKAVFDADRVAEMGGRGEAVILVRQETNPDDVHGMIAARGILTARGGATSHAAVVARGMGKPCVAGTESISVDVEARRFTTSDGRVINEGDDISIDGTSGEVYAGLIPTSEASYKDETDLIQLLTWADGVRKLGVWANADYPRDAERAIEFGAEGIGLCRTEHMFFEEVRLPIVQRMILAAGKKGQEEVYHGALAELEAFQTSDFHGILAAMGERPVVVRLLDPPLHEFLPSHDELLAAVSEMRGAGKTDTPEYREKSDLLHVVEGMREQNPMLGLRGDRLGILYPAIYEMQVRALLNAVAELEKAGSHVHAEIMIPLTGTTKELEIMDELVKRAAATVEAAHGGPVAYKYGTMIEVPRAALIAGALAERAEFFSFGTNDLTQTTFGYSRDDAEGKFLLQYVDMGVLPLNPFQTLDREGVGRLVELATREGRAVRPDLTVGICGEHGGDPDSIAFCHQVGLNYVSCSPFRVPVARLAAAQAVLASTEHDR